MAGDGTTTTRFSFREPGQQTVLEPGFVQALMDQVDACLPARVRAGPTTPGTAATTQGPTAGTGVAITFDYPEAVRHMRLTLTGAVVPVDDSDGEYGGLEILNLPDRNLLILNAEANLSCVKGAVANGIAAGDSVDFGIGTAIASANTLATTMQNVVPKTTVATNAATVTFAASTFSAVGTGAAALSVPDTATSKLYLNATTTGGSLMSADDTITATGTVDLWYIDLGNITS
jgi:hypothetical protein